MNLGRNDLKIVKVQRLCLRKLFLVEFINCLDIFITLKQLINPTLRTKKTDFVHIIELGDYFDELASYISRQDVVQRIDKFLYRYYRYLRGRYLLEHIAPKITSKVFLSIYIIVGFPEFILMLTKAQALNNSGTINHDLYQISNKLVNAFNVLCYYGKNTDFMRSLNKHMNMYSNCFSLFMGVDKNLKIQELVANWRDLETTISQVNVSEKYSDEECEDVINTIRKSQNMIIALLLKTDPGFNLEILSNF